jgi:hypothetical protein
MPVVLGPLALAIFQAGGPIWLANALVGVGALGSVFTAIGQVALSFGISAIAGMLYKPKPARPEDVQQSLRVAISDRVRIYGQYQATGNWIFGDSKDGVLHKVLVVCEGKLVTVLNLKIDDNIVTVDGDGLVQTGSYENNCRFLYRRGLPTETYYSELAAAFPEWTSAHRGNGVVTIYATQFAMSPSDVTQTFPSLKDTLYRIEGRFTEIYNPVTGVIAWSDNAAGVIRNFMISPSGMRIPIDLVTTPLAHEHWKTAWTRCAALYSLKAGGTEARYRLWGAYKFSQTPGSVLETMLANCDARPILTRDGGVSIYVGNSPSPTVTLDKHLITACVSITQGMDVRSTANKITAKFLSKDDDYLLVDADPWVDEESVSTRGELVDDTEFSWTPSHSQARRLMKLRAYRLNPEWVLTVNCRLGAIAAFQEPFVTVDYTIGPKRIFGTFEVTNFTWNIGDKGVLRSFTIALRSIDAQAYEWSSDEEGTAPVTATTSVSRAIPAVASFNVTVGRRNISGTEVAYAILGFDAPAASLSVQLRGKKVSESNWTNINVPEGATSVDGPIMDDGVEYEFQARNVSSTGRKGSYTTPSIKITPVADVTAPGPVVLNSAAGGVGQTSVTFTTPNNANFSHVVVRRNTVNNFVTSTVIGYVYGSPNTGYTSTDSALAAGTYYYWLSAANASGVEASAIATGALVVT